MAFSMAIHVKGIDSKIAFYYVPNATRFLNSINGLIYMFFSYPIIHWVNTKSVCVINFKLSSI